MDIKDDDNAPHSMMMNRIEYFKALLLSRNVIDLFHISFYKKTKQFLLNATLKFK